MPTNADNLSAAMLMPQGEKVEALLQERASFLAQKTDIDDKAHTGIPYIRFRMGKEYYGITYEYAKEVLLDIKISKIPHTAHYIAGAANRHGTIIGVIDLTKLFNLPNLEAKDKTAIIVIKVKAMTIALLVDSIENSIYHTVDLSPPFAFEGKIKAEFIVGLHKGHTTILNMESLLGFIGSSQSEGMHM